MHNHGISTTSWATYTIYIFVRFIVAPGTLGAIVGTQTAYNPNGLFTFHNHFESSAQSERTVTGRESEWRRHHQKIQFRKARRGAPTPLRL